MRHSSCVPAAGHLPRLTGKGAYQHQQQQQLEAKLFRRPGCSASTLASAVCPPTGLSQETSQYGYAYGLEQGLSPSRQQELSPCEAWWKLPAEQMQTRIAASPEIDCTQLLVAYQ